MLGNSQLGFVPNKMFYESCDICPILNFVILWSLMVFIANWFLCIDFKRFCFQLLFHLHFFLCYNIILVHFLIYFLFDPFKGP
jgi:hypothetical protein